MSFSRAIDTVLDRTVIGGYPRWGFEIRRRMSWWPTGITPHAMAGRSVVITGASSGLGKCAAAQFMRLGAQLHLIVRNAEKGKLLQQELSALSSAAPKPQIWRCDVSNFDDVATLAAELQRTPIDILVHNAGLLPATRSVSAQGHEITLATHVLGPLRMTELLRPALRTVGKSQVIWVSSGGMYTQSLAVKDPEYVASRYRGAQAYARTKRIQVSLLSAMAQRWASDGIRVHAMHPGWADTPGVAQSIPGFYRMMKPFLRTPEQGVDTLIWLAATNPPPISGKFWHDRRPRPEHLFPWTRDTASERATMWDWCAQAAGVAPYMA